VIWTLIKREFLYSGIAENSIQELKASHPDLKVLHLKNSIDLSKVI
jgi:hypothetical protein